PSRQILRFAEAIRSAELIDHDSVGTYREGDYENLLDAQNIVNELLPPILRNLRAHSINSTTGWRYETVKAGDGDHGLCAICKDPYQHFNHTVRIHCIGMHPHAYHGVCRECVRQYAPMDFIEGNDVEEWLRLDKYVCEDSDKDKKSEAQRKNLIDAVRRHGHSTHYFADIVQHAPEWAKGAYGEWR
ncbi:MAG: hypothetical protein CMJ46_11205, partial [Planctomyces sp.]|nr:hypothetical protein [Planctomyces sp.]